MTHEEIGRLLAYIAAFDKRTTGRADVLAWHDVLGDLDYDSAKQAVRCWYRDNDGMIRPAQVRAGVLGRADEWAPYYRPIAESIAEAERIAAAIDARNRRALESS